MASGRVPNTVSTFFNAFSLFSRAACSLVYFSFELLNLFLKQLVLSHFLSQKSRCDLRLLAHTFGREKVGIANFSIGFGKVTQLYYASTTGAFRQSLTSPQAHIELTGYLALCRFWVFLKHAHYT